MSKRTDQETIEYLFTHHNIELDTNGYGHMFDSCGERRNVRVRFDAGIIEIDDGDMDRWANSVGLSLSMPSKHLNVRKWNPIIEALRNHHH